MEAKGLESSVHLHGYERIEELVKKLDEGEPLKAYIAVRKLFSIAENTPDLIAQMHAGNPETFDSLKRRLEKLTSGADPVLRAHVKELKAKVDDIAESLKAPKGEEEPPEKKCERVYLYLRDANPFVAYKGLRILSTVLEREPKSFVELTVNDPTLVEGIKEELKSHSVGKDGTIKVDAKNLLVRMDKLLEAPTEEGEVPERRAPPERRADDETLGKILEKLTDRPAPASTPAPAPTPIIYTPPPSQANTIVEKLLTAFMSAKTLSILFIVEGVIFFLITGLMYTADFQSASINPLATVAFYCLIIGVVFRVLEDYYGDEKLEKTYEKHSFEFNIAKLFLVVNALFFLLLAVMR